MKIIGLCGGSGSGKGVVSQIFQENNIPCIDTDKVYREMTSSDSPCLRALADEFGDEIISSRGSLDRVKLASLVFTGEDSKARLSRLNEISHSFILGKTREILEDYKNREFSHAIVDAPVLFESGFNSECHIIICVVADKETRIKRIMERDSLTEDSARHRINSQLTDEELISRSDFVITNNSDLDSLRAQIHKIINSI